MSTPRRVRRGQRRTSIVIPAAVGLLGALVVVVLVALGVSKEIAHRTDSSWHYEPLTLSMCSTRIYERPGGTSYLCSFETVPPLPVATDSLLDADSAEYASHSAMRWVHVVNGRIVGTDGPVSLWTLAFLLIPAVILGLLALFIRSSRRERRR